MVSPILSAASRHVARSAAPRGVRLVHFENTVETLIPESPFCIHFLLPLLVTLLVFHSPLFDRLFLSRPALSTRLAWQSVYPASSSPASPCPSSQRTGSELSLVSVVQEGCIDSLQH
ncbi:unnamed protein product [Jaminaea pallidilutea]